MATFASASGRMLVKALALATASQAAPALAQASGSDAAESAEQPLVRDGDLIVVTAQRRAETLAEVPIAVTALSGKDLEERQIESIIDIQNFAPNVSFNKSNFAGSNLQIRGVGSLITASTADSGVAAHVDDIYLVTPRLFETEYYDVERVELLRGPQGTLFGRNATGGTFNLITKRAELGVKSFTGDISFGNYDALQMKGALNLPLTDELAVRVSGLATRRDGSLTAVDQPDGENSIDGRALYSVRGSLRWEPGAGTKIDVILSWFDEDDDRVRSAVTFCDRDPSAILGCAPTGNGRQETNYSATLGGILPSSLRLGSLALFPFGSVPSGAPLTDSRQVYMNTDPIYRADELFFTAQLEQRLSETLTLNANFGYQDTSVYSNQPSGGSFADLSYSAPASVATARPITYSLFFRQGLPISEPDPTNTGVVGGNVAGFSTGLESYEISSASSKQYSGEARLSSQFSGPVNFLIAGNYLDYRSTQDFYTFSNSLDYFALVAPALAAAPDGVGLVTPYLHNQTESYDLSSVSAFGELYVDVASSVRLTGGLRYSHDSKFVRDRSLPFLAGGAYAYGPAGEAAAASYFATGYDADPSRPGIQPFREDRADFNSLTGRAVIDWTPEVRFASSFLAYASYSRGFKSGGFNPPFDPTESAIFAIPRTYGPEKIDAYEIGVKTGSRDGSRFLTLAGFYYDYTGLQVGRVVARTTINDNVDARIWGAEATLAYAPVRQIRINVSASYLGSQIKNFATIDSRDPTAGRSDVILIKDTTNANSCVVTGVTPAAFTAATHVPLTAVPGLNSRGGFASCAALQTAGLTVVPGIATDVSGNELPNTPNFKASVGIELRQPIGNGVVSLRTDYIWQADMWGSIFNDPRRDTIPEWNIWNAQMAYKIANWRVGLFVRNILDRDHYAGYYVSGPSTGLSTRATMLEPRTFGGAVSLEF